MKKSAKIGLVLLTLISGATLLSSCTASFCSVKDRSEMLYAFDYGVTNYYSATDENLPEDAVPLTSSNTNVYYTAKIENNAYVGEIITNAVKQGYRQPSLAYFEEMDRVLLNYVIEYAQEVTPSYSYNLDTITTEEIINLLDNYGYLKYYDSVNQKQVLWTNWEYLNTIVRQNVTFDQYPDSDFITYYKSTMNSKIQSYNSCLATKSDKYGYYGYGSNKKPIEIEEKTWAYAWKKGFLEGLLIYPIGWAIDSIAIGFSNLGMPLQYGVPQVLAILFITLIIRLLLLLVTFKQTTMNAKMQELQPELAKIQAKYPNSNTNQREKELMAMDTQKLYKKHKINPFLSIIVMIIQFPVFICVWGAMSGSSVLSSGEFLGLRLSDSISSVLFNGANWTSGSPAVWTAIVLFVLMGAAQVVSMLLPQWIQKAKQKKVSRMGRNPGAKSQNDKMKMVTYIMMVFIIFMGFSLASGMGIYWFIGALISIAQTLIIEAVNNSKKHNKKKERKR
ncbi:MAG: membrane protein insertase YidC [Bacilli bacterium]